MSLRWLCPGLLLGSLQLISPCFSPACRHWAQVDWDQAAIQALLYQMYPDLIETYMRLRHPAMRADLAKFMILHT